MLVALILPSGKLINNDGTSAAAGGGNNGKDNMNDLP